MFKRIIPVALNPALDITLQVDGLSDERINTVLHEETDAAGKATNVSKALRRFGVENTVLILAGRENADNYFRVLSYAPAEERISWHTVYNPGLIRENLHIIMPDGGLVTVRRMGFTADERALGEVYGYLERNTDAETLVMMCGRLPEGMGGAEFRELCGIVYKKGGKLAVDSASVTLEDLTAVRPWLIKPNLEELEQYTGRSYTDHGEMCAELARFCREGIENVMLSLGGDGLIWYGGGECLKADVPEVREISPVGAGDSTLSGFIVGMQRGLALCESVRLAAAFGTAAVTLPGTKPPLKEDVAAIYEKVKVHPLAGG